MDEECEIALPRQTQDHQEDKRVVLTVLCGDGKMLVGESLFWRTYNVASAGGMVAPEITTKVIVTVVVTLCSKTKEHVQVFERDGSSFKFFIDVCNLTCPFDHIQTSEVCKTPYIPPGL